MNIEDWQYPALKLDETALRKHFQAQPERTLFNPDFVTSRRKPERFRAASVLIPLVRHSEGLQVLLTRRTGQLSTHAGQIAFPGGRRDAGETNIAAALREAHEEVGLPPTQVEVLGELGVYRTLSGFEIQTVVGLVEPFQPVACADEVDAVFQVPFDHVMDGDRYELFERNVEGEIRSFYAVPYQDWYIWGATAGILFGFYEVLLTQHLANQD